MLTAPITAQTWQLGTWLLLWKSNPPSSLTRPPPRGAWKCPRLLIWDHTSPPPSPRVNKSTFLLFCPVSNGVYCKWKMAPGAPGCLTVLSSALQLEHFLERSPVSWLKMETEKKNNSLPLFEITLIQSEHRLSVSYWYSVADFTSCLLFCKYEPLTGKQIQLPLVFARGIFIIWRLPPAWCQEDVLQMLYKQHDV